MQGSTINESKTACARQGSSQGRDITQGTFVLDNIDDVVSSIQLIHIEQNNLTNIETEPLKRLSWGIRRPMKHIYASHFPIDRPLCEKRMKIYRKLTGRSSSLHSLPLPLFSCKIVLISFRRLGRVQQAVYITRHTASPGGWGGVHQS